MSINAVRKKWLRRGLAAVVLIGAITFAAAHLARLPTPPTIISMALALEPESGSYEYFDVAELAASSQPRHFVQEARKIDTLLPWHDGTRINLDEFQEKTHTQALLILHKDKLVYENYRDGNTRESLFTSFSVAKSMLSALVGIAVQEGKIKSLDDPIGNYLPDLAPAYARIRINDLLNMRSGVDVPEVYDSPFSKIAYMYATTDLNQFIADLQAVPLKPAGRYNYRSVDYLLLGQVLRQASGGTLTNYLEQKLWQPMGAEYGASWSVDSSDNLVEKGFCCINARAIDFLKFGALYLHQGRNGERQILPPGWLKPQSPPMRENDQFSYSDGWWIPLHNLDSGDFSAIGVYGQYIYISPKNQTVIVKFSDHGAEEDEGLTVAAFHEIAATLARSKH